MNATLIQQKLSTLKIVISDVDGVLTDGSLFFTENGESIKQFNVQDGFGIKLLQLFNIKVAVISARKSKALEKRMKDLDVIYYTGAINKQKIVLEILQDLTLTSGDALFIGDDLVDIPGFKACGISAAPKNAISYVRDAADIKLQKPGGQGAFRELVELILAAKNIDYTMQIQKMMLSF